MYINIFVRDIPTFFEKKILEISDNQQFGIPISIYVFLDDVLKINLAKYFVLGIIKVKFRYTEKK